MRFLADGLIEGQLTAERNKIRDRTHFCDTVIIYGKPHFD